MKKEIQKCLKNGLHMNHKIDNAVACNGVTVACNCTMVPCEFHEVCPWNARSPVKCTFAREITTVTQDYKMTILASNGSFLEKYKYEANFQRAKDTAKLRKQWLWVENPIHILLEGILLLISKVFHWAPTWNSTINL